MKRRKLTASFATILFLFVMLISDREHIGMLSLLAAGLHECGHLLGAKLMKIPLSGFHLDLLGARIDANEKILSYSEEWLLAASGPLASFLCSLLVAPFWSIWEITRFFSCISFLLGILNLLPIRTFDGGRMLECIISHFFTPDHGRKILWMISFVFLFFLWALAVYFLLRAGDGISLFCFSCSLLSRFWEKEAF